METITLLRQSSQTLPHFSACPKPEPGFPRPYVMVFFVFYGLR